MGPHWVGYVCEAVWAILAFWLLGPYDFMRKR